jgi:AcrR family transcriptional regulator
MGGPGAAVPVRKRADARRNERMLLDAAGAAFVTYGVDAPVREIAARAGVGTGTIYRHFPTRADLIVAVYEYQVDACVEAGPSLLETSDTPYVALTRWVDMVVDFLVTKHGLAAALQSERETLSGLHPAFVDRLVPVLASLLEATSESGEIRAGVDAFGLMRAVGNLCIGGEDDPRYDAHEMVALLVAGLRGPAPDPS